MRLNGIIECTNYVPYDTPVCRLYVAVGAGDSVVTSVGVRLPAAGTERMTPLLTDVVSMFDAYFAGQHTDLLSLPCDYGAQVTDFRRRVWDELRRIPYGMTATYGEISAQVSGSQCASRAVGAACGANPLLLLVPCHRVIGCNGSLTGFAAGLRLKQFLLMLERRDAWL